MANEKVALLLFHRGELESNSYSNTGALMYINHPHLRSR